jgi:hypothetical protein
MAPNTPSHNEGGPDDECGGSELSARDCLARESASPKQPAHGEDREHQENGDVRQ